MYACCNYKDGGQLTLANGTKQVWAKTFSINDPYDPSTTLGNTSAQGYDFWGHYYGRYHVYRTKYIIDFINDTDYSVMGYMFPNQRNLDDFVGTLTDMNTLLNIPQIKYCTLTPKNGGKNRRRLVANWYLNDFKGDKGAPTGMVFQSSYGADVGSNPPVNVRMFTGFCLPGNVLTGGAIAPLYYRVTIKYYTMFYGRKIDPGVEPLGVPPG